ncbi:amidohydrolase family protein [Mesorhizobium sp. GR13]|uniref:amidohydrolase family protein n=1 Tax=Mesorhizobium sp. GR13 TaxID=2562308 RepID=UPI0010C0EC71|nr:amidohydrolase family protein [Mesorhizobium sp. GR13]
MSEVKAFEFVDVHHHLWDLSRLHYAWLTDKPFEGHPSGDYSSIMKDYLITDLQKEGKPVNLIKSVHIETADGETDPVRETEWLQEVADKHGMPNGIISRGDLMADNPAAELERHMQFANFRGVRMLSFMGLDFLDDQKFRRGFNELQKRDLIYDMDAGWPQMGKAYDLARAFPRATIILGHCGFPRELNVPYFNEWRKGIRHLAQAPNVACKLSGLLMVDHNWTVDSIRPWIETCIESFGPERCMFATNWPLDGLHGDYVSLINAYREIVKHYSEDEQRSMFVTAAEGWYRI